MTITSATETPTIISRVAGWLSPEEFHILEVACDTLLPSLEPPPGSSVALAAYYRRRASDLNVAQLLAETLTFENAATQTQFHQLMSLMASPVTSLLLAGTAKPFIDLSQARRGKYLFPMDNSPTAPTGAAVPTRQRPP